MSAKKIELSVVEIPGGKMKKTKSKRLLTLRDFITAYMMDGDILLAEPGTHLVVRDKKDMFYGHLLVKMNGEPPNLDHTPPSLVREGWWIEDVYVPDHARRNGIASMLLDYVLMFRHIQWKAAGGCSENLSDIHLVVKSDNAPAKSLYLKHGFEEVKKSKGFTLMTNRAQ